MTEVRNFTYRKDNGETSKRSGVVVSTPRDTTLMYDVSKFDENQARLFTSLLETIENYRDETLAEFEAITGIKINSLWRSFKPGGIDWEE